MKTLLVAFLFCLTSTIANADASLAHKPVVCDDTKTLFKILKEQHEEMPVMMGKDSSDDSRYALFVNAKTGTWTFVQFSSEMACMLGFGREGKVVLGEKV